MDECSLPKARPILCNESPAFQRHHMSLFCAAESPNRFPWVINTTFGEKTYIRWCCNDRLSSQPSSVKRIVAQNSPADAEDVNDHRRIARHVRRNRVTTPQVYPRISCAQREI